MPKGRVLAGPPLKMTDAVNVMRSESSSMKVEVKSIKVDFP